MKTNLQTIYAGLFIALLLNSCGNESPQATYSTPQEEQPQAIEHKTDDVHSKLVGRWQLDSTVQTASGLAAATGGGTITQNDLGKNAKLKNGNVITYYKTEYTNTGDNVQIDEFTNDGKHITTTIDKFSVKQSKGKNVNTTQYEMDGNNIVETWKWGANNENENSSTSNILKIDSQLLVYEFDNGVQPLTFYFSKITN